MSSMKKTILAVGVTAICASSAMAQVTSTLYFTTREYAVGTNAFRTNGAGAAVNNDVGNQTFYAGAVGNPTLPGVDTPVLYLSPTLPGGRHIRGTTGNVNDRDTSKRPFQLWLNTLEKYLGANSEELISSVGVDITSTGVTATGPVGSIPFPIATRRGTIAPTLTMYTATSATNATGALWDGVNIVTPPITDARGVTVPDSVGDFANGATPNSPTTNSYRVAELMIQAGGPGAGGNGCKNQLPTRYDLKLVTGNVLITRAVNPAFGGALTPEIVAFGYAGGAPEPATANGSTLGGSSTVADAAIEIRFKGDYRGLTAAAAPNGNVNATDVNSMLAAVAAGAAASPLEKWLGDFVGLTAAAPPQGTINGTDVNTMLGEVTYFVTLPNCP